MKWTRVKDEKPPVGNVILAYSTSTEFRYWDCEIKRPFDREPKKYNKDYYVYYKWEDTRFVEKELAEHFFWLVLEKPEQ